MISEGNMFQSAWNRHASSATRVWKHASRRSNGAHVMRRGRVKSFQPSYGEVYIPAGRYSVNGYTSVIRSAPWRIMHSLHLTLFKCGMGRALNLEVTNTGGGCNNELSFLKQQLIITLVNIVCLQWSSSGSSIIIHGCIKLFAVCGYFNHMVEDDIIDFVDIRIYPVEENLDYTKSWHKRKKWTNEWKEVSQWTIVKYVIIHLFVTL